MQHFFSLDTKEQSVIGFESQVEPRTIKTAKSDQNELVVIKPCPFCGSKKTKIYSNSELPVSNILAKRDREK